MGILLKVLLPSLVAFFAYRYVTKEDVNVVIDENAYFGAGLKKPDDPKIVPFKIQVPEEILVKIKEYWLTKYDWRKIEAIFNSFPNFKTQIEGLQVHFIHSKAAPGYKKVFPLLVVHGWPGSVYEFHKFIPILNNPKKHGINVDFAFDVVAPSIPGYGWSEQPKKTGFSQLAAARVFRKLMERLGHKKFYCQAGDWGAVITKLITAVWPEQVFGLHNNMLAVESHKNLFATLHEIVGSLFPSVFFSSENIKYNFFEKFKTLIIETGYMHIQATKPDTIGVPLNDSPIGLAAYFLEKISAWTNNVDKKLPDGGLNKKFTNDELLTMVMVYWVNQNIVSSQRFYREFFLDKKLDAVLNRYISVPTGHASGTKEIYDLLPVEIGRHYFNITHYVEIDMGHFAALEAPKPLAKSVFQFVGDLENL